MEMLKLNELQCNRELAKLNNSKLDIAIVICKKGNPVGLQLYADEITFDKDFIYFILKGFNFSTYNRDKFNLKYFFSTNRSIFYKMEV